MRKLLLLLALLIQTNAMAMGEKPQDPIPAPIPKPIAEAPKFTEEEIKNFINNQDYYAEGTFFTFENDRFNASRLVDRFFDLSFFNTNIKENDLPLFKSPALVGYKLKSMAKNGKNYILEVEIKSHLLPHILANRESTYRVKYEGRLAGCDNVNFSSSNSSNRLEEAISILQGINLKNFYSCQLDFNRKAVSSEVIQPQDFKLGHTSQMDQANTNMHLYINVYQNGQADFNFSNLSYRGYSDEKRLAIPSPKTSNQSAKKSAFQAANSFIKLIKEHGIEIARSAMLKNLTESERQTILVQSLVQKKPQIIEAMQSINEHFGALEIIDRLSISKAVGDAYKQVENMERTVGLAPDYSLVIDLNPYMLEE